MSNNKRDANTRKLAAMGIFAAMSVVLVFLIHFPIFPAAPFLEYDPADIPILIVTFAYGPLSGIIVTVIAAVIQGLTVSAQSGPYGIIMHIISTGTYVLVVGLIYHIKRDRLGAGMAIACGVLVNAAVMSAANLIITPIFMGAPVEVVKAMLIPAFIPFNLVKAGGNGIITFLLYNLLYTAIYERVRGSGARQ